MREKERQTRTTDRHYYEQHEKSARQALRSDHSRRVATVQHLVQTLADGLLKAVDLVRPCQQQQRAERLRSAQLMAWRRQRRRVQAVH